MLTSLSHYRPSPFITKRDHLLVKSAASIDLTLQYSDNIGGYSLGTPYAYDDVEWNPLKNDAQAIILWRKLKIDVPAKAYSKSESHIRLYIVIEAARLSYINTGV